jgi:hypothetical protein
VLSDQFVIERHGISSRNLLCRPGLALETRVHQAGRGGSTKQDPPYGPMLRALVRTTTNAITVSAIAT